MFNREWNERSELGTTLLQIEPVSQVSEIIDCMLAVAQINSATLNKSYGSRYSGQVVESDLSPEFPESG